MMYDEEAPEEARGTMDRFTDKGTPPGGFIRAVLANDLTGAFETADDINSANMKAIVSYAYCHVPYAARGSYEKVAAWIERRGKDGKSNGPS